MGPNSIQFTRPLDGAVFCIEKNFKVFPVKTNAKEPYSFGWQKWAEQSTHDRVSQFGTANPLFNWGIYCGASNLIAVDIDIKEGRKGQESLDELIAQHGPLPKTLTCITPSGGTHYIFKGETKSINGIRPGIDIKSRGGYIVAPGSRIDNKSYEVLSNAPIAPAPEWLITLIESTKVEAPVIDQKLGIQSGERNEMLTSLAGTMRRRGMNHEAILQALFVVNETQVTPPLPVEEVELIAKHVARYAPEIAQAASDFLKTPKVMATRAGEIDLANIPKRDWVMHHRFIGGFVSMLIAPGGVGKSTLALLDAAAVATGKPLSGFEIIKRGPVWCYNLEDPDDELRRRIGALSIQHGLPLQELNDIHFTSGRTQPMIFVKEDPQAGLIINEQAIEECVQYIKKHGIVLFILDPMVRIHEVEENDNNKMAKVISALERVIAQTGCSICLVHHFSKAGRQMAPGEIASARGATSPADACRIAHTLSPMTEKDADRFGIPKKKAGWYLRLDNAKANLQPPAESAFWYERKGVILPNGDDVGTLVIGPSFKDITAHKALEAEENERTAFADFLFGQYKPGDEVGLVEVYQRLQMDIRYKDKIGVHKHDNTVKAKVMQLLTSDGILWKGMRFRYERRASGRVKDVMVAEQYLTEKTGGLDAALE